MEFKCEYCDTWIEGRKAYNQHQITEHNLFKGTDTNITEETIAKLRTTMARVKFLLESYPATRGDDRILILTYLRLFEKHLIYNESTQLIEFRKREGISFSDWRDITSFETLTRARRKIQESFKDLLPSEATQAKRDAREKAIRGSIKTMSLNLTDYKDIKSEYG